MDIKEVLRKWNTVASLSKQVPAVARRYIEVEKKMLSIAAVTGLSFDEVKERTQGWDLDMVYKAAALTGELLKYDEARSAVEAARKMATFDAALVLPKIRVSRRAKRNREMLDSWHKASDDRRVD